MEETPSKEPEKKDKKSNVIVGPWKNKGLVGNEFRTTFRALKEASFQLSNSLKIQMTYAVLDKTYNFNMDEFMKDMKYVIEGIKKNYINIIKKYE
tara:strand:- start:12785 stop:13069 length:285 start_codon:yes stop_codon:yes gene_type:complete